MRPKTPSTFHYPALDGLRGIALLGVFGFHLYGYLGRYVLLGFTGVALFFVLSGFLITGILIDTRDAENFFRSFYTRRALRIFPLYYWTLLILFFLLPAFAPTAAIPPPHDRIYYFFYLNNCISLLHQSNNLRYVGHFWSLAVEEQFYWAWPLFIFVLSPKHLKWAIVALIAVGIAAWIYLFYFATSPDAGRLTLAALPSLMVGAACAVWVRKSLFVRLLTKGANFYAPVAVGLFMLFAFLRDKHSLILYLSSGIALDLSFLCALLAALFGSRPVRLLFEFPPLRRVGRYSYGMYVYHIAIITAFAHFFPHIHGKTGAILIFSICYCIAALSFELIEKRINGLKQRFRARFEVKRSDEDHVNAVTTV